MSCMITEMKAVQLSRAPRHGAHHLTENVLKGQIPGLQSIHHLVLAGHPAEIRARKHQGHVFLLFDGAGSLRSGDGNWQIGEIALFIPRRGAAVTLTTEKEWHCLEVIMEFLQADWLEMESHSAQYPYLLTYGGCQTYTEDIKSAKTVNRTLLPERTFPRLCIGSVETEGPDVVAEHQHPMLEQLFLGLKGNRVTVRADDQETPLDEFTLLHLPLGSRHGVRVDQGDKLHYVWIDAFKRSEDVSWITQAHRVNSP